MKFLRGYLSKNKRTYLPIFLIVNLLFLFVVTQQVQNSEITSVVQNINEGRTQVIGDKTEDSFDLVKVLRVVDGDTIVLETGETLRYIGIDAPEESRGQECFSRESTDKNKVLVLGKEVRLEKDVSEKDRFGRLLRYIWALSDSGQGDIFVNEQLVREGYATASTYPPDVKYSDLFKKAESEARENNRGLWGECGPGGSPGDI